MSRPSACLMDERRAAEEHRRHAPRDNRRFPLASAAEADRVQPQWERRNVDARSTIGDLHLHQRASSADLRRSRDRY